MATGPAAGAVPAGNLTANPSFESSAANWNSWQGSVSRVGPTAAPDGQFLARVTRSSGSSYTLNDAPATISSTVEGDEYTATATVRAGNPQSVGRPVTITLRERTPDGSTVRQTRSSAVTLGAGFRSLQVSARALSSGNTLDVRISQASAIGGDAFEADEVAVVPAGAIPQTPDPEPSDPDPAPDDGGENLTANPSFESGLTGWSSWQGSLSRLGPFDAPEGQYAARVTRSTGTSYSIHDTPATVGSLSGGDEYTARASVRAANAGTVGRRATLIIRERAPDGQVVDQTASEPLALTGDFQALQVSATAVGSGNTLDVRVSQGDAFTGYAYDVDRYILPAGGGGASPPPAPTP
ncbi:MAG: carbohydrate binding domain-containing protein, partial [Miltoncostaeaceae bacterium]